MRRSSLFALLSLASLFAVTPASAQTAPSQIRLETLPIATRTNVYFLAADTCTQVAIPNNCGGTGKPCDFTVFAVTGGRFWLDDDAECEVPTTTITDGSAPEPNPSARFVPSMAAVYIVTDEADVVVYVSFYRLAL